MPTPKRTKRLTDLELEIMQVVWDAHPEPLTVRAVVDRLQEDGRRPAYTTIQTVMGILREKGVLASRPGPGRAHLFRTRLSRADAARSMTQDFVQRMFGGKAEPLLAHLLENEELGRDALAALKRRIEGQLEGEEDAS